MLLPALRPALLPALQTALGAALNPVALAMLTPHVDGTMSVTPVIAKSAPTFTRASIAYGLDWENVYRLAASGEARQKGTRRVENLCTKSEPSFTITTGGTTPPTVNGNTTYLGEACGSVTLPTGAAAIADSQAIFSDTNHPILDGQIYRARYRVALSRGLTGGEQVRVHHTGASGLGNVILTASSSILFTTYSPLSGPASVAGSNAIRIYASGALTGPVTAYITRFQIENITAQSNQNPGEYIATTTTAAAKYFTTTNGNTVAGNVVTAAAGLSLHPTHVADGVVVFDHYRSWVASTAYLVGQRIIPTLGAYAGGGNGFWYECTVAGTSGASAPTWPTTGFGVTTVSNGGGTPTWRIGGYYRIGGYLTEGARTNSLLHSRALSNVAWVQTGTPTPTANAVGFDGVPNSAWTLTDDDAAVTEALAQTLTVPNDGNTHVASVFITKDAITSRFPEVHVSLSGGTLVERAVQINTLTGAIATRLTAGSGTVRAEDHGDRWRLVISVTNNTTGNVTATVRLSPAAGTTLGVLDVAATGAAIFGQAQVELNVAAIKVASTPIVTTTVAVTRAADTDDISKVGHFNVANGCALADYEPVNWAEINTTRIIGSDTLGAAILAMSANSGAAVRSTSGAVALGPIGTPINAVRAGSRWSSTKVQVAAHATGGTEATDTMLDATTNLKFGRSGSGNEFFGAIKNIRLYTADPGTARLNVLSDYDFDLVA